MSKRLNAAVEKILSDPENLNRTAEEVAELAIEAIDEARAKSHRLLVVGQIQHRAQGETYTVALGPFSARGTLDSQEKFQKATQGGSAAREAGQGLAWDSKAGQGQGRFMLVPCFRTARDAWDFYRGQGPAEALAEGAAALKADLEAWQPGQWAERMSVGPACTCGLSERYITLQAAFTKHGVPRRRCQRHDPGDA